MALVTFSACDSGGQASHMANAGGKSGSDAINLTDSNIRATVTVQLQAVVTSAEDMYDAAAEATTRTMDVSSPPMRFAVHAGYTQSGVFAYDQVALDAPEDPFTGTNDGVRTVRVRNGAFQLLDANGVSLQEGGPGIQTLMGASPGDALNVLEGAVLKQLPAAGTSKVSSSGVETVTNVSQSGGLATVVATVQPSMPGAQPLTQTRVYQARNRVYVLHQVLTDVNHSANGFQVTGQARIQFDAVTWSQKLEIDYGRAAAPPGDVWGSEADNAREPIRGNCDPLRDDPCDVPGQPVLSPNPPTNTCLPVAGQPQVVFVHGIKSDGGAWSSERNIPSDVRCQFQIGGDRAPSLAQEGTQAHAAQTAELTGQLPAAPSGLVFVGHSQGGIISRRVAQQPTIAGRTRAIVTTGTPHRGAHIARTLNPRRGLGGVIDLLTGQLGTLLTGGGTVGAALTFYRDGFLTSFSSAGMADLRPDSDAIRQVNAPTALDRETFGRYAIQNDITRRWAFARVAGDALPGNHGGTVHGIVRTVYWGSVGIGIFSALAGSAPTAAFYASVALALHRTDQWWTRITVGRDKTDGVVAYASQGHPRPSQNGNVRAAQRATHTGQIDTGNSSESIRLVLRENVGLRTRQ